MGAVEVQSLGYYTVVDMCFVRFRASQDAKSTSSFETEDISQEEVFFTLWKVLAL